MRNGFEYMNAGQQMAWLNGYWAPEEVIETEHGILYREVS